VGWSVAVGQVRAPVKRVDPSQQRVQAVSIAIRSQHKRGLPACG
jgi:hypothetical protein